MFLLFFWWPDVVIGDLNAEDQKLKDRNFNLNKKNSKLELKHYSVLRGQEGSSLSWDTKDLPLYETSSSCSQATRDVARSTTHLGASPGPSVGHTWNAYLGTIQEGKTTKLNFGLGSPGTTFTDGHFCAQRWCLLWTNCDWHRIVTIKHRFGSNQSKEGGCFPLSHTFRYPWPFPHGWGSLPIEKGNPQLEHVLLTLLETLKRLDTLHSYEPRPQ